MTPVVLRVELKRPPMTSNDQRRAHWTTVRRAKATVGLLVSVAARTAGAKRVTGRVDVHACWHAPDARVRDGDALGPFLKASLDALVQAKVLPADDHRWVRRTSHEVVVDRADPHLSLTITEVDA